MHAAAPVAQGEAQITNTVPGLFSADAGGKGAAAAQMLRVKADGTQRLEPVAEFEATENRFVPVPIELGPARDRLFLVLYGTGLRFRGSLSTVHCTIGGVESEVLLAGAAPGRIGLDQVQVRLPRARAGRGAVEVILSVDGQAANPVRVRVR